MMKANLLFLKKSLFPKLNSLTGFTLAELMVASLVLVTILVGLLASYVTCFDFNETSRNLTTALNAAQLKLDEMRDHSFSLICTDFNNTTFTVDDMPAGESRGTIYVFIDALPTGLNPDCSSFGSNCPCSDYDILRVVISVCWRQKSGRVIGEDKDLDGVLDIGEDKNGNSIIDSPAQVVSYLTAD
jgi:type II secretory pathway pseudopilin PulG